MSSASGAWDGQDVKAEAALVKPGWFSQGQRWLEQDFSLVLWVSHRFVYFFRGWGFFSYSSVAIRADASFHSPTWKSKTKELFLAHKMSPLNVLTLEE